MIERSGPKLEKQEIGTISNLGLAHLGDAVFELLVRSFLVQQGIAKVGDLHKKAVAYVAAPAQAAAIGRIYDDLSPEEQGAYKRGRNAKVHAIPKGASLAQYHAATGLETLFGYLYLQGNQARIYELFDMIVGGEDAPCP